MAKIFEELQHLVKNDLSHALAGKLGKDASHVDEAAQKVLPTLLAKFMTKSESPQLHHLLEDAGKVNLPGVDHTCHSGDPKKPSLGERFVSGVMGPKGEEELHALAAGHHEITPTHAKTITAAVGAVVAGFLGKKLIGGGGVKPMLADLAEEKNDILAAVPADWQSKFQLSHQTMHCTAPAAKAAAAGKATMHEAKKKKGGLAWLWWLLGLLALILLCCLIFCKGCTSCSKKAVVAPVVDTMKVALPTEGVETYELVAPDGEKLVVRKGGMIDKMVAFLNSDTYKNGDEDVMRKHWFEFENVDFKFNSGTEFEAGSPEVIKRLVFLMKYRPDVYMRFGGEADMKDGNNRNMPISQERAETIKKLMVEQGVAADRITTRGFGSEKAVIPATATDAERAPDRDFAMRFQKR